MSNYLIITGGSRGIGKSTLDLFIKHGWKGINISRTPCDLPNVKNFSIDLSNKNWSEQFAATLTQAITDGDKICLVHNAAAFKSDNVTTLSEDALRSVLEINLVAAVLLNKIYVPLMKENSSIVYIGSTLSELAVANRASYVISKHAVIGLMRSTSQDMIGKNIHTCCICPGFVNTKMLTDEVDHEELNNFIKQKVIPGRLIEPEEIADLIYFSATHPLVNGAILHANLGQITN